MQLILIILTLSIAPVYADDFQDGLDAAKLGDYKTALEKWKPLAEQGNAGAQNNLAGMYGRGQDVLQDYKEAIKWYRLASEQGLAEAQFNLGWMYNKGQGVLQDYKEAVKWYRLAAEQGLAEAQFNLGKMYREGQGVTQDPVEAYRWYNIVAQQGYRGGYKYMTKIEKHMTPAQIAEAQKLAREWMEKHK